MDSCSYLGHLIGNGEVRPEESKVQAMECFPTPVTKKQIRAFLGLTGYSRKFIPGYAEIAAPLVDLTKKSASNKVEWTDDCNEAFTKLKRILCSEPILKNPSESLYFRLMLLHERGIGAVLTQCDDLGQKHPIAYFICKILPRAN